MLIKDVAIYMALLTNRVVAVLIFHRSVMFGAYWHALRGT
jgi:hypothetical protein